MNGDEDEDRGKNTIKKILILKTRDLSIKHRHIFTIFKTNF